MNALAVSVDQDCELGASACRHAAANSGLSVVSAVGYTNARAGIGGFPLGFAAILWFSLLSSRRLLSALAFIASVAAVILMIRLYSAAYDGTFAESMHIVVPEVAILMVSLIGIRLERRRHSARDGRRH